MAVIEDIHWPQKINDTNYLEEKKVNCMNNFSEQKVTCTNNLQKKCKLYE